MKKIFLTLLFFISLNSCLNSQVEYIPSDHPVYKLLDKLSIKGILTDYDDIILPLPEYKVVEFLKYVHSSGAILTSAESELVKRYLLERYAPDNAAGLIPGNLNKIFSNTEKKLYQYSDSLLSLTLNPVFEYSGMYSPDSKDFSSRTNFGGKIFGSYNGWFGFSVLASNALISGNRDIARLDPRTAQSFTFNETGLNFTDHTEGHLSLQHGIINFQLGRERLLWGAGYLDKMNISGNAPIFDYIRFGLAYKAIKYDFIHGWLVRPAVTTYIDSLTGNIRSRGSKYIALNRLGVNVFSNFNIGINQAVIYAGRTAEAAYLNPFLFWESAQRSLGDLDNSFLSLDMRWKVVKGFEWSFTYLFDDVHFGRLFKDGWNVVDNKIAIQTGIFYTPFFMPDLSLVLEYSQIRPFTFSHAGLDESLAYTNNGFFLGLPMHPNSVKYSLGINYLVNEDLNFNFRMSRTDHGSNEYSPEGFIIRNYGGNIFENLTLFEPSEASLLGGILEKEFNLSASVSWEFIRNYYLDFSYNYNRINSVYRESLLPFLTAALIVQFE
jgi:hypothetical protein